MTKVLGELHEDLDLDRKLSKLEELEKSFQEFTKSNGTNGDLNRLKKDIATSKMKYQLEKMDLFDKGYLKDLDTQKQFDNEGGYLQTKYVVSATIVVGVVAFGTYMYMKSKL